MLKDSLLLIMQQMDGSLEEYAQDIFGEFADEQGENMFGLLKQLSETL